MADNPAHVPAGPDSDEADARVAVLVGAAEATLPPRATNDSMDDLPVWSFRGDARPAAPTEAPASDDRHQVELPFIPPAELAARAVDLRPQPLFGPVGRPRSAALVALLATVTLGVSAVTWHHRVNRELEEFDPKLHSRPRRSAMAVAVPWLVGVLSTLAGAALIVGARLSVHVPFASHVSGTQAYYLLGGLALVPYLVLVIPFSLVAVVMTLERLRSVEEHVGTTTDRQVRPVAMVTLLAIPVVGGLILVGVAQRRINAVWDAVAPAGHLSR
jgi:hypothetical protein